MRVSARPAPTMIVQLARRCLTPVDALLMAVSPAPEQTYPSLAHHVRDCRSCRGQVSTMQAKLERTRSTDAAVLHLDESAIAALLDVSIIPSRDDDRLAHLAACTTCRGALLDVREHLNDERVLEELSLLGDSPSNSSRSRSPLRTVLGIAAAAAAVAMISIALGMRGGSSADYQNDRSQEIDGASSILRFALEYDVAQHDTLRWSPISHASRYRVVVFDGDGRKAWSAIVADTFAVPSVLQMPGRGKGFSWRVRADTSSEGMSDAEFSGIRVPAHMER